jgi:L-aminopeptidase/D-esterase-like protein
MAHDGLARSIRPVHTMFDGDTVFALATGKPPKKGSGADATVVGTAAAEMLAQAVVRAARQAESLGGVPAACDLKS